MAAMTMDYTVDDAAVLKKVRPGDQIMATVYDGDPVLHKVEVMPKSGTESGRKGEPLIRQRRTSFAREVEAAFPIE